MRGRGSRSASLRGGSAGRAEVLRFKCSPRLPTLEAASAHFKAATWQTSSLFEPPKLILELLLELLLEELLNTLLGGGLGGAFCASFARRFCTRPPPCALLGRVHC